MTETADVARGEELPASSREDQCVIPSSTGGWVNVIARISSRTEAVIVGGFPDLGSSARPPSPR